MNRSRLSKGGGGDGSYQVLGEPGIDPGTVITPALRHARLNQLQREGVALDKNQSGGGALKAFAFTVNFVFGAGVLSIPYSVAHAGIVGSCVFMVFTAFLSAMSMIWIVEALGRAEALLRNQEEMELASPTLERFSLRAENQGPGAFRISRRRLEVNELTTLFLGNFMGNFYSVCVTLYCICSMWFYGVIFSLSLTQTMPLSFFPSTYIPGKWHEGSTCDFSNDLGSVGAECRGTYTFYLGVFLIVTMIAACFDLAEQKKLQSFFTILAMSSIVCMLITLLVSMSLHPYEGEGGSSNHSLFDEAKYAPGYQPVPLWIDWGGFSVAYMNFVFAFLAHTGVPGLVQLLKDKSQAPKVFMGAMGTACTVYMALGAVAAYYFGSNPHYGIQKLVTLNWRNYNGDDSPADTGSALTIFISYMVRMYPVISVTSAFTLYADTVAASVRAAMCPRFGPKNIKILWRWVFIVISIFGAAMKSDISVIITVCGLLGIILVMVVPSLLQIYSKKQCNEEFGRSRTPFSWHFSNNAYVYGMVIFGFLSGVYCIYYIKL